MTDRPSKLARLQSLRYRVPFVSQQALSSLLQIAAKEPLPDLARLADIRDARDSSVREVTPYGPLHQEITIGTIKGEPVKLEVQHPLAMLYKVCAVSSSMSDLISRTATARPSSPAAPWRIILYGDEILPGNQLAHNNKRKSWGIYWSILDFGTDVISNEELRKPHNTCMPASSQRHRIFVNINPAVSYSYSSVSYP